MHETTKSVGENERESLNKKTPRITWQIRNVKGIKLANWCNSIIISGGSFISDISWLHCCCWWLKEKEVIGFPCRLLALLKTRRSSSVQKQSKWRGSTDKWSYIADFRSNVEDEDEKEQQQWQSDIQSVWNWITDDGLPGAHAIYTLRDGYTLTWRAIQRHVKVFAI